MKTPFKFERDRAYHRLVDLIFGGSLDDGAPLSERKLAEQLGFGRMPVREALHQLEQEGVVEVKPARGTFVRSISTDDLDEIYQVREALECLAAEPRSRPGRDAATCCLRRAHADDGTGSVRLYGCGDRRCRHRVP
ncbi:GntR family transcriptional regulator [Jiella pelagia]|uniref:GntR family transcriptional regulator n=1 Tax=Jiella pelagia TaxID=2986949 RepID=A0ABY7BXC8_9HYPH|nr:GntR family transcriptional regulator [Jiella pelagia]WAP68063.1 GntR family transcriptional regulator [Jiella pelagia]